jgi:uncharacterized protein (DUF488 family)
MSDAHFLYTIGYEKRSVGKLVRTLQENSVERLVDVRLNAQSRKKGFSVLALFEALRKGGINYEHVRELGNPPEIRSLFWSGEIAEGRDEYREHLTNGQSEYVDYLVGLVRLGPTAILCLEDDPDRCHRSVIADVAQAGAPDIRVVHL